MENENNNKNDNKNRKNNTRIRRRIRTNNRINMRNKMINRRFNRRFNNVIKVQNPKTINMNIKRNDKNMIITGKDIILTQDNTLNENGLFACLPINPAYWDNTRIKNLAILNQYYIPISIKLEYVPLVSKFQKGNITIGTIANSTMQENNIQATLISSTSGITYSCSNSFVREIQINSLIPQKKLLINSKLDKESVPFYICIYFNNIKDNGENILPGQFYINYMFKFFNPVTAPGTFKSQQNIPLNSYDNSYFNISCMLTQDNINCKIGTILDVERKNDEYTFLLNGTEVEIDENKLATFFYSEKYIQSQPQPPQPGPIIKTPFNITSFDDSGSGSSFDMADGFDILVDVPYSYDYIEITLMRAGVTSLTTTLSQSYFKLFKSTDYPNDSLPPPLDQIVSQVIAISAEANYTKMRLSTQYVEIIN